MLVGPAGNVDICAVSVAMLVTLVVKCPSELKTLDDTIVVGRILVVSFCVEVFVFATFMALLRDTLVTVLLADPRFTVVAEATKTVLEKSEVVPAAAMPPALVGLAVCTGFEAGLDADPAGVLTVALSEGAGLDGPGINWVD